MKFQCYLFISLLVVACTAGPQGDKNQKQSGAAVRIKYAEGFRVADVGGGKLVEVVQPYQGSGKGHRYLLVEKDKAVPPHDSDVIIVRIPIATIVCTSTTHIPLLDYLNESEALIGFPTTDYISSERIRKRIDLGYVTDVGTDKGMDIERIVSIRPDLVMGYLMSADYGQFKKLGELGVPVIINAEYLEKHPLGRAEWIKYMALFFKKEHQADSIFDTIEKSYLETQQLASATIQRPTVMSGVVYGDTWFLPGGQNYAARLLKDAGCNYLWADDDSNGYLELSFESVYEKANNADFWIGVASFNSLPEIKAADVRYTKFKPYKSGRVYTYDARKGAKGGSEFLELGYLRPDIILKDLVKIVHPELLPNYPLYFHKALE